MTSGPPKTHNRLDTQHARRKGHTCRDRRQRSPQNAIVSKIVSADLVIEHLTEPFSSPAPSCPLPSLLHSTLCFAGRIEGPWPRNAASMYRLFMRLTFRVTQNVMAALHRPGAGIWANWCSIYLNVGPHQYLESQPIHLSVRSLLVPTTTSVRL